MGIFEGEMQRFLNWVDPKELAEIQAIKQDFDRNRAFMDLVGRYSRAKLEDEQDTYVRACVGESVWIFLPGDHGMNRYEGEVVSIEMRDGNLVAKLKDRRYPGELIEFDPRLVTPGYYKKRKTDARK